MKPFWSEKYFRVLIYFILTVLAIYITSMTLENINSVATTVLSFLGNIMSLMSTLIIALVISFLFSHIVDYFQKVWDIATPKKHRYNDVRFKRRVQGTAITFILIILVVVSITLILVSKIGSANVTELANSINESIQEFSDMFVLFQVKLAEIGVLESVDGFLSSGIEKVTSLAKNTVQNIAYSFTKAGSGVINLVIGLTISFYLLAERDKILYYCNDVIDVFFNEKKAGRIKTFFKDLNNIFYNYVGGQILDAVILGALISISFSIAGIKYPIIIGIISGIANLVPYVGAMVAFVISVAVGLLSGTPIKALYAAIIVIIMQQIDSIFIVPRVVGKSVELNPVLVILALSIFGKLFGVVGMIIAVPCTAIIKTYLLKYYNRKRRYKLKDIHEKNI